MIKIFGFVMLAFCFIAFLFNFYKDDKEGTNKFQKKAMILTAITATLSLLAFIADRII